jgi:serine/threonine protein kinase
LCLACLLGFGLKEADPAELPQADAANESDAELAGISQHLGQYRLIEKLGEGGCGVVYRAEQLAPVRREVAIKVIKLGMDSRSVLARFDSERQALAMMDHSNIARFFDAGVVGQPARPYFVMELICGEVLTQYCQRRQLSLEKRLGLFIELCQAIQHAHQKGIIHRDLKPSNVLVVEENGVPRPKVIDFGVARATSRQRLTDDTIYTAFDQFVGTPAYMSPEQAGLTGEDIDTRSDIYSLGVLLYELLTDEPPFDPHRLRNAALDEVCRIIRDEDPVKPSTRLAQARGAPSHGEGKSEGPKAKSKIDPDLDWIVMKALEKDRSRRYETANALALDIQRNLRNEPVLARSPGPLYRLQKLARRNKLAFGAGTLLLVTLIAGFGFSTWRFLKEQEARRLAAESERAAKVQAARSEQVARLLKDMLASVRPSVALGRDSTMLREILDSTSERIDQEPQNDPSVEAEMREVIGRSFCALRQLNKAEMMHRKALRLRENLYPGTNSAVVASLIDLAIVLNTRGGSNDLTEAEPILRRALATLRQNGGNDTIEVADVLNILAWNIWMQRKSAEPERLYREALAIRTGLFGPDDVRVVPSLESLAWILASDSNRLDEAETYIRKSVALQEVATSPDHPSRIDTLDKLSIVLRARAKMPEAEAALRASIALRRKLFGNVNEVLCGPLQSLAGILVAETNYPGAEQAIRESIAIQKQAYGDHPPALAESLISSLVKILHEQEKWAEAEVVSREWVPLLRRRALDDPDTLLDGLFWLGLELEAQRKWAEAEPPLRESLELCEKLHESPRPPGSTRCMGIRRALGEAFLHLQRYAEAEPLLLASYEGLKGNPGKWETLDRRKTVAQLAELYDATARPDQAVQWRQKLADDPSASSDRQ